MSFGAKVLLFSADKLIKLSFFLFLSAAAFAGGDKPVTTGVPRWRRCAAQSGSGKASRSHV